MVYLHKPFWVTQRGSLALSLDISERGVYCRFLVCVPFQFDVSLLFMLYKFLVYVIKLVMGCSLLLNLYTHVYSVHSFVCLFLSIS